ncbi:MAG: hypothetical protein P9M02_04930 [Candidatus Susulua stagnicola]|nr:hypothetical protein [Candidatus Susulua stagnicola]
MSIADRNKQLELKVGDIVKELEVELIEFKVQSSAGKNILRCIVDFPEGGITLDSCASVNRRILNYFEESGGLYSNYAIEVNSPGLDKKLYNCKDFLKVKGRNIFLWLNESVEDKEYLEGQVLEVDDDKISLSFEGKILKINFNKIKVGKEKIEIK